MSKFLVVTTSIFGLLAVQGFAARADEALDKAAKDHPDAFRVKDYREAFDKYGDRFDAVIVSTPDFTHCAIDTLALSKGKHVYGQKPLVQQLALTACRLGNDPHNQEIAQCLLEDYAKNRGFDRDRLLLACVQHTAGHRKYGDFLECSRRYGRAMGVASLG